MAEGKQTTAAFALDKTLLNSSPSDTWTNGKDRINCGVIGDCVNLAARVESMTKMYGASFLISEFTHARLADPSVYALRVVDRVRAKGKTRPVTIYEVLDGLPAAERDKRIAD
jgi:class 3 adenylate cyclase